MRSLLQKLLQEDTETEILEFKEAKNQYGKDNLGKYFSALSNEANLKGKKCAWLLLGIKDDKNITGTNISTKQLNEYKTEMSNHTSPRHDFVEIHRVEIECKDVLMFEIPTAPKGIPVAWKGHYYGRDGESLGALSLGEIEQIRTQAVDDDWSAQIINNATIDDLSQEAILKAKKEYIGKNPKNKDMISSWNDSTFLNKAKLCINGKITRTAILLLGKSESDHYISPGQSKITWILRDRDNIEKDYAHFFCPLLLEVENVYAKIRNLKYRYLQNDTIFPAEVNQFEPYIIREALNNCIAHQDYSLAGQINIVEREDGILTFINSGNFIPGNIKKVIDSDAPETKYRNPFLANAMVNLNMIDTIGSGIRKMFVIQKDKLFPLPDYDFSENKVKVTIIGKVENLNYARKLAKYNNLSLKHIMMLDKVAKQKPLLESEIKELKQKHLIEGRKPNFYISSDIAKKTGGKASYIKQRGLDDEYCQKLIIDYLTEFEKGTKTEFENMLLEKLPDILNITQKKNKIKNNLQRLRKKGLIETSGKSWIMSKTD